MFSRLISRGTLQFLSNRSIVPVISINYLILICQWYRFVFSQFHIDFKVLVRIVLQVKNSMRMKVFWIAVTELKLLLMKKSSTVSIKRQAVELKWSVKLWKIIYWNQEKNVRFLSLCRKLIEFFRCRKSSRWKDSRVWSRSKTFSKNYGRRSGKFYSRKNRCMRRICFRWNRIVNCLRTHWAIYFHRVYLTNVLDRRWE